MSPDLSDSCLWCDCATGAAEPDLALMEVAASSELEELEEEALFESPDLTSESASSLEMPSE